jgi:hypothetical protein
MGPTGYTCPTGYTGHTGVTDFTGPTGYTGFTGPVLSQDLYHHRQNQFTGLGYWFNNDIGLKHDIITRIEPETGNISISQTNNDNHENRA